MAALDRKYMIFKVFLQEDNKEKLLLLGKVYNIPLSRLPWGYKQSSMISHAVLAELAELLQTVSLPQDVKFG